MTSLRVQNRRGMCGLKSATEGFGYAERFRHGSAGRAVHVQSSVHGQPFNRSKHCAVPVIRTGRLPEFWVLIEVLSINT